MKNSEKLEQFTPSVHTLLEKKNEQKYTIIIPISREVLFSNRIETKPNTAVRN